MAQKTHSYRHRRVPKAGKRRALVALRLRNLRRGPLREGGRVRELQRRADVQRHGQSNADGGPHLAEDMWRGLCVYEGGGFQRLDRRGGSGGSVRIKEKRYFVIFCNW